MDIHSFLTFLLLSIAGVYIPSFSLCSWFRYPLTENPELRNLMISLPLYSVCTVCVKFSMPAFRVIFYYIKYYFAVFNFLVTRVLLASLFRLETYSFIYMVRPWCVVLASVDPRLIRFKSRLNQWDDCPAFISIYVTSIFFFILPFVCLGPTL